MVFGNLQFYNFHIYYSIAIHVLLPTFQPAGICLFKHNFTISHTLKTARIIECRDAAGQVPNKRNLTRVSNEKWFSLGVFFFSLLICCALTWYIILCYDTAKSLPLPNLSPTNSLFGMVIHSAELAHKDWGSEIYILRVHTVVFSPKMSRSSSSNISIIRRRKSQNVKCFWRPRLSLPTLSPAFFDILDTVRASARGHTYRTGTANSSQRKRVSEWPSNGSSSSSCASHHISNYWGTQHILHKLFHCLSAFIVLLYVFSFSPHNGHRTTVLFRSLLFTAAAASSFPTNPPAQLSSATEKWYRPYSYAMKYKFWCPQTDRCYCQCVLLALSLFYQFNFRENYLTIDPIHLRWSWSEECEERWKNRHT